MTEPATLMMDTKMKRIVAYKTNWVEEFSNEANLLDQDLGLVLINSHHIGSTSVPGMLAKPVVDILLEVTAIALVDDVSQRLEDRGYVVRGEYGIEGRRYFSRKTAGDASDFHVHAYEAGHPEIQRHICFRDYLRSNQNIADQYSALKRRFSDADGFLSDMYQIAKRDWVDTMSENALLFYKKI